MTAEPADRTALADPDLTAPLPLAIAIARAVDRVGGTVHDAMDLVWTWETLVAAGGPRADRMRHEAQRLTQNPTKETK